MKTNRFVIGSLLLAFLAGCGDSSSNNNGGTAPVSTNGGTALRFNAGIAPLDTTGLGGASTVAAWAVPGFNFEQSTATAHLVGGIVPGPYQGEDITNAAAMFVTTAVGHINTPTETTFLPDRVAGTTLFRTSNRIYAVSGETMWPPYFSSGRMWSYTASSSGPGIWDIETSESHHTVFAYYFVKNDRLVRLQPAFEGSYTAHHPFPQRGASIQVYDGQQWQTRASTSWANVLVEDLGRVPLPGNSVLMGDELIVIGGTVYDGSGMVFHPNVVRVNVSDLDHPTVTIGPFVSGDWGEVIYVDTVSGRIYLWTEQGVYVFDTHTGTNELVSLVDDQGRPLQLPFSFTDAIVVSDQGLPQGGRTFLYHPNLGLIYMIDLAP